MDDLKTLLRNSSPEERESLAELLGWHESTPEEIAEGFWYSCQSLFGYLGANEPSYIVIVEQVAEELEVESADPIAVEDLEIRIAQHVLETVWEEMSPQQRKEMEQEMKRAADQFDKSYELASASSIFAALTAAQLSGFGVYILASTSLGALTGVAGVALPFAAYTTMSSAIAIVIGPVGWIGAGIFAVWKITGASFKRLVPAIVYVSALRAKAQSDFDT